MLETKKAEERGGARYVQDMTGVSMDGWSGLEERTQNKDTEDQSGTLTF